MEKLAQIQLSEDQKKLVEHEFRMTSIFVPNFERKLSKKLWNDLKLSVYVTYKGGYFIKAETESKPVLR
tara:strand:+ start:353 stop:559 length:207 start_codon:yes stop_codon:yes gene_type:complete